MTDTAPRHPATEHLLRQFRFAHLPAHLQAISKPVADLVHLLLAVLPDGPELSAGLRHLLEAKDCFVRVAVNTNGGVPAAGPEAPTP